MVRQGGTACIGTALALGPGLGTLALPRIGAAVPPAIGTALLERFAVPYSKRAAIPPAIGAAFPRIGAAPGGPPSPLAARLAKSVRRLSQVP